MMKPTYDEVVKRVALDIARERSKGTSDIPYAEEYIEEAKAAIRALQDMMPEEPHHSGTVLRDGWAQVRHDGWNELKTMGR